MEQIGFIGTYDKKDLLLDVCAVLNYLGKKTLIVDATSMQRFRYIVPNTCNNPYNVYVSEYHGIDVAIGFMNLNGVAQYLGAQLQYDYILIDTDNIQTCNSFMIPEMQKIFFVTSYDTYDVQRGIEVLKYIQRPVNLIKIVLSADITINQENYLNHLIIENSNIKWDSKKIQFADEIINRKVTLENQLSKEISLKKYSSTYKDGLEYLTAIIAEGQLNQSDIRRVIRKI